MKTVTLTLIAATLVATPLAAADTPMNAQEFDTYTKNRTVYYSNRGRAYGVEEYLPGQRVKWSFLDGQCKDGYWYQQAEFICFVYEDDPDPQCWTFWDDGQGLRALFEDDPTQTELFETVDADEPMLCLGPQIGV